MKNKRTSIEKNIETLLNSAYSEAYRPNQELKEDTLQLLEQKFSKYKEGTKAESTIVIGLSLVWTGIVLAAFYQLKTSIFLVELIKPALSLSLLFIPVSSIVLIILKWKIYEKKLV